ncbi:MAG: class 1 isoprenoid biosynthesis enzyme [Saprospiraceae bacterium]|nr:class 1 isoprenoid biosynthesis enzyme [Saprospiraceae bacterium]
MYRFINLLLLARVSIPFLSIYLAGKKLPKEQGAQFSFWQKIKNELPDLQNLEGPLQRRIYHYLFANSLTTQWFATLLDYTPSVTEKETGFYIATATPIADYLVDREKLSTGQIEEMLNQVSTHPWQRLVSGLFSKSMEHHPDPSTGRKLIFQTLKAQEQSLLQHHNHLPFESLKKITWDKGGYALLLYRSALGPTMSKAEYEAVFQLGGLMQLHNDIFDLYRDTQEGIVTLPMVASSMRQLSTFFQQEIDKTYRLFITLPYRQYQKRKFFLLLYLAVQTGFHALKQYEAVEKKYGHFDPSQLTRSELVCDMDDLNKISKTVFATINKKHI